MKLALSQKTRYGLCSRPAPGPQLIGLLQISAGYIVLPPRGLYPRDDHSRIVKD